jgi:hypothetical protein
VALIVLCSAKGSPGVTTTALALTLVWPRPVLLVEADPAGGDVMAGYLRGQVPCDRGLLRLAIATRHGRLAEEFSFQLINLNRRGAGAPRLLLPGLTNPSQVATIAPAWTEIAAYLTGLGTDGGDVIVDAGRIAADSSAWPLISAADRVLLVVRTTLRSVAAAIPIAERLVGLDDTRPPALITVDAGDYRPAEVGKHLGLSVSARLPWLPQDAAALSDGDGSPGARGGLLRAARDIARALLAGAESGSDLRAPVAE